MSKLHEILAVEGNLQGATKLVVNETVGVFTKKPEHFKGFVKTYVPFIDGKENEMPGETSELVTTVDDKLVYTFDSIVNYLDVVLQKEATNQVAKSDIVIDGNVIATDVPATFLLGLEAKLKDYRAIILSVPTLAPGIAWELDPAAGKGVFRTKNAVERIRAIKEVKPLVIYEATKEHPAQVKMVDDVRNVGKYVETSTCSMKTPSDKSDMLGRVDALIRAVKQARQRANNVEVLKVNIGKKLVNFILG